MDDFYGNNNGGYNNGYNNNGYNSGGYNNGYNNGYGSSGYNSGYNNNGYGGYNNGQNFGYNNGYQPEEKGGAGLAIASFVISLVNLTLCCTLLSFITAPLCIIFSIVSLVKKRKGTVLAIFGIIFSLLASVALIAYGKTFYDVSKDMVYFAEHEEQIIEDYDRDGTIPHRFDKYRDHKYDDVWGEGNTFDDFFDEFVKRRKEENNGTSRTYTYTYDEDSSDLALGFQPALLV